MNEQLSRKNTHKEPGTDCEFFFAPGAGIMTKIGDNKYSNEKYIDSINESESSLSFYMQSKHPTHTYVSFLQGKCPPESWKMWGKTPHLDIDFIHDKATLSLDIISGIDRLTMTRGEISTRLREIISNSTLRIIGKGIRQHSQPENINQACIDILLSTFFVIEKSTTASLKQDPQSGINLTTRRQEELQYIYSIVKDDTRIITDTLAHTSYKQPSSTGIERIYEVGSIIGLHNATTTVNTLYRNIYQPHIESIHSCMKQLQQ